MELSTSDDMKSRRGLQILQGQVDGKTDPPLYRPHGANQGNDGRGRGTASRADARSMSPVDSEMSQPEKPGAPSNGLPMARRLLVDAPGAGGQGQAKPAIRVFDHSDCQKEAVRRLFDAEIMLKSYEQQLSNSEREVKQYQEELEETKARMSKGVSIRTRARTANQPGVHQPGVHQPGVHQPGVHQPAVQESVELATDHHIDAAVLDLSGQNDWAQSQLPHWLRDDEASRTAVDKIRKQIQDDAMRRGSVDGNLIQNAIWQAGTAFMQRWGSDPSEEVERQNVKLRDRLKMVQTHSMQENSMLRYHMKILEKKCQEYNKRMHLAIREARLSSSTSARQSPQGSAQASPLLGQPGGPWGDQLGSSQGASQGARSLFAPGAGGGSSQGAAQGASQGGRNLLAPGAVGGFGGTGGIGAGAGAGGGAAGGRGVRGGARGAGGGRNALTINLRGAGAEGGGAGEDGFSPVPGGVANSVGIKLGPEPQNIWEDETIPYNIDGEALTAMDNELYEPLHFFDEDQRDVMIDVINDKVRRILRMDPSKWKHGKLPFGLRDETVRQYVEQMGGGPDEDLEETVANLKDELEMLKAVIRRKDFQIQKGENLLKRLKESGQIASTLEDPFKDDGGDAGGGLGAADGGGGAPPRRRGMIEQPPAEDDDDGGGGRGFTALELKEQVNKAVKPYQETINDLKQQLTDLRAELAKKAAQKPTPEQPKPRRRNRRGPGDDGEGDDDDCDDDGDDNDVGEGEEPGPNGRRRRRKKPTEPAPDPPPAPAPIPDRPDPSGPGGRRPPVTGDGTEPGPAPPPPDLPAPAGPDRELVRANDTLKASVEALVKMGDQLKDLRKFTFRALSAVGASQMLKPDVSGERRVEELMRECKAHGDQRAAWADGIRKVPSTDIALPQAIARDLTEMSGTGGASGAKAREYDAALRKWCEAVLANLKAPQAPAPKPKPTPVEEPEPVPAPAPAPVDPPPPSGPSPAELENAKLKEKNKKQQEELAKLLLTIDELRTRLEALPAAAAEVGPGAVEVVDAAMGRVRLKDLTRQLAPPKLKGVFERLYTDAVQRIQRYNLIQDQVVLANKIFVAAANAIAGNEEAGELPDLERLNATAQAALRGMWYHTDHMFKSLQEYAVSKGMDATSASMRAAKPSIEEMMEAALDEDFDDVLDLDEGPRPRPAGRRSDRAPKYPGAVGNRAFWNPLPGGVGPPPKSPRDLRNKILQDPEPTPFTAYVAQLKEARGDMGRDEWRRAAAAKPDRIKPASANKKLDALLAFPRKPPAASGLSGSQSLPALPKGRNHYQANDLDA